MTPNPSHSSMRAALRAYVDKWEAWEESHGREASIPMAEWNALVALSQHEFKPESKQEVDDVNYVGTLLGELYSLPPFCFLQSKLGIRWLY